MSCSRVVILLAVWLSCTATGCSLPLLQTSAWLSTSSSAWKHGMETRAISNFVNALEDEDLPRLRNTVSPRFAELSLNYDGAMNDLALLNLPSGEVTILEVVPDGEERSEVKAQVGEAGREYTYLLSMDRRTHAMVVDDVIISQQEASGRSEVTQTVTAQLELLQAGRRFLSGWSSGSREQVLETTTQAFRTELEALPPSFLVELTSKVAGDRRALTNFHPEARIDGDRAAMVVRRSAGQLLLEMKRVDGTWMVNDAAVDSSRENEAIPSARRLARTLRTAAEFLNAYDQGDQEALARTSQASFYDACLRASNPDAVPLPVNQMLSGSYELRRHGEAVDVLMSHQGQTYLITMAPTPLTNIEDDSDRTNLPRLVQEVTIYEGDGSQVKTLTAVYTSRVIVQLFAQALKDRNVQNLTYLSSPDFNAQVWRKCDADVLRALPLDGISMVVPEVVSTVFHGSVTEVTVRQGGSVLTYVLKSGSDHLHVDDVLVPLSNRPSSLKTNLTLLVPVYRMVYAVYGNNQQALASVCGYTLERTCAQLDCVPNIGCSMVDHLLLPVASIHPSADRTVIKLGDGRFGADVTLRNESNRWVVEDVSFITGSAPEQRIELLAALRRYNTNHQLNLPAAAPETRTAEVTPADTHPLSESPIEQAGYMPEVLSTADAFGAE